MEPQYKSGFPKHTWTLNGKFVFELKLFDGSMCDAFVTENKNTHEKLWRKDGTTEDIPTDQVAAWRETYTCKDARLAIDQYKTRPHSIVSKGELGNAFTRHVDGEPCTECRSYYETLFPKVEEISVPVTTEEPDPSDDLGGFDPKSLVGAEPV